MKIKKLGLGVLSLVAATTLLACANEEETNTPSESIIESVEPSDIPEDLPSLIPSEDTTDESSNVESSTPGVPSDEPSDVPSDEPIVVPSDEGAVINPSTGLPEINPEEVPSIDVSFDVSEDVVEDQDAEAANKELINDVFGISDDEFLNKYGISATTYANVMFGENLDQISLDKQALVQTHSLITSLKNDDDDYKDIVPSYKEGEEKELVTYLENKLEDVAYAMKIVYRLKNVASNEALFKAVNTFSEAIPMFYEETETVLANEVDLEGEEATPAPKFDSVDEAYTAAKNAIDEVMVTTSEVSFLVDTMKGILDKIIELNPAYLAFVIDVESPNAELTDAQINQGKTIINATLNSLESALLNVVMLTKEMYTTIGKDLVDDGLKTVEAELEANKAYLLNYQMKNAFVTSYLSLVAAKSYTNLLANPVVKGALFAIKDEMVEILNSGIMDSYFMNKLFKEVNEDMFDIQNSAYDYDLLLSMMNKMTEQITIDNYDLELKYSNKMMDLIDSKYIALTVAIDLFNDYYNDKRDEMEAKFQQGLIDYDDIESFDEGISEEYDAIYSEYDKVMFNLMKSTITMYEDADLSKVYDNISPLVNDVVKLMIYSLINDEYLEIENYNYDILYYQNRILEDPNNKDYYEIRITECERELVDCEEDIAEMNAYIAMLDTIDLSKYKSNVIDVIKNVQNIVKNVSYEQYDKLNYYSNLPYSIFDENYDTEMTEDEFIKELYAGVIEYSKLLKEMGLNKTVINDIYAKLKNLILDYTPEAEGLEDFEQELDYSINTFNLIFDIDTYDADNLTAEQIEKLQNLIPFLYGDYYYI